MEQDVIQKLVITDKYIEDVLSDQAVIVFIRSKFKRISRISAKMFGKLILERNPTIKASDLMSKPKAFIQYNMSKFEQNTDVFKVEFITEFKKEFEEYLFKYGADFDEYYEKEKISASAKLSKYIPYERVRQYIGDEADAANFYYDFEAPDLLQSTPKNVNTLQRMSVQIITSLIKIQYPVEYFYPCQICKNITRLKAYETVSTNGRAKCMHYYTYTDAKGEPKVKQCGQILNPDVESGVSIPANYYNILYYDEKKNTKIAQAISFQELQPGSYDCVYFLLNNPKKEDLFQIMCVKPTDPIEFILPEKTEENYFFTLQRAVDDFIFKQTGLQIYGLYPIKVALLLQSLIQEVDGELSYNIQLIGDSSTGKSMILKYYGLTLNNTLHLSTNGASVSVPGMRGTPNSITLLGREYKFMSLGHLGTYNSIHIDEAGENKELVKQLKNWLYEANYSYDKAGSLGNTQIRRCHVNLSENLDHKHLGQYRGSIRKSYKDDTRKVGDEPKDEWDETWDLHLPLYKYDNPYLRTVVKEKRNELVNSRVFWIDGYDIALHERFPFYFYLVNEKPNDELISIATENVGRKPPTEIMELMKLLRNTTLMEFFRSFKEKDISTITIGIEVKKILESYGFIYNTREINRYVDIVKYSAILNGRKEADAQDYHLLKWLLENTNCKIDVADTATYEIQGAPNIEQIKKEDEEIEDATKQEDDMFGIPDEDFE